MNFLDQLNAPIKPLFEGIELAESEKYYLFDYGTSYKFQEVEWKPIHIADGLDTALVVYKDMITYYKVIEGMTGTCIAYVQDGVKKESIAKVIAEATDKVNKYLKEGTLEKMLQSICINLTRLSPRYKGEVPAKEITPNLFKGDEVTCIEIRGSLSTYKKRIVEANEKFNSVLELKYERIDKEGYGGYITPNNDDTICWCTTSTYVIDKKIDVVVDYEIELMKMTEIYLEQEDLLNFTHQMEWVEESNCKTQAILKAIRDINNCINTFDVEKAKDNRYTSAYLYSLFMILKITNDRYNSEYKQSLQNTQIGLELDSKVIIDNHDKKLIGKGNRVYYKTSLNVYTAIKPQLVDNHEVVGIESVNSIFEGVEIADQNKFFVYDYRNGFAFKEVNGIPVNIADGIDTFLHTYKEGQVNYVEVIEGMTGICLAYCTEFKKMNESDKVIGEATELVNKYIAEGLWNKIIQNACIYITGLSPRYKGEVPKKKVVPNLFVGDEFVDINICGHLSTNNWIVSEAKLDFNSMLNYRSEMKGKENSSSYMTPNKDDIRIHSLGEAIIIDKLVDVDLDFENEIVKMKDTYIKNKWVLEMSPQMDIYNNPSYRAMAIIETIQYIGSCLENNEIEKLKTNRYSSDYLISLFTILEKTNLSYNQEFRNSRTSKQMELNMQSSAISEKGAKLKGKGNKRYIKSSFNSYAFRKDVDISDETAVIIEDSTEVQVSLLDMTFKKNFWEITPSDIESNWYDRSSVVEEPITCIKEQIGFLKEELKTASKIDKKNINGKIKEFEGEIKFIREKLEVEQMDLYEEMRILVSEYVKLLLVSITDEELVDMIDTFFMELTDSCHTQHTYDLSIQEIVDRLIADFESMEFNEDSNNDEEGDRENILSTNTTNNICNLLVNKIDHQEILYTTIPKEMVKGKLVENQIGFLF